MAYYVKYTKTCNVKLPIVFKCEKCGKINVVGQTFTLSESYNDKGTFTKSGLEKREEKANLALMKQQENLADYISEKIVKRDLVDAGFTCMCQCGAIPKWAYCRNDLLDKLTTFVIFASVIMALFLVIPIIDGNYSSVGYFLIPIFMSATVVLLSKRVYEKKKKTIKELPEQYMPILCKNQEQLQKAVIELNR